VNARKAHAIVTRRSDNPRAEGPVVKSGEARIQRIGIVRSRIDAIDIIDIAIAVVINPVGRFVVTVGVQTRLARIAPHVLGQVWMLVIDSRIQYRDDQIAAAGCHSPGVGSSDLLHVPLRPKAWIIGNGAGADVELRRFQDLYSARTEIGFDRPIWL